MGEIGMLAITPYINFTGRPTERELSDGSYYFFIEHDAPPSSCKCLKLRPIQEALYDAERVMLVLRNQARNAVGYRRQEREQVKYLISLYKSSRNTVRVLKSILE